MSALAQTPLHAWHAAHGGRMVDFAGWSMPVQYGSIALEHHACRRAAALFDVSHMGRLRFTGRDSTRVLDHLLTRRMSDLAPGQIRYSLVTNHQAGILDDVLIYRLHADGAAPEYQLVVNASNRVKIIDWVANQIPPDADVQLVDRTAETAMIAVQGPRAVALAQSLATGIEIGKLKYYTGGSGTIAGRAALVSRTGYTGEDGCELVVAAADALAVWEALLAAGQNQSTIAAGLAARDTLRLEAAMPLYGHELSEEINPVEAGLDFAITLDGRDFIGREAILLFRADPTEPKRVGIELAGKRVPRQGYALRRGGEQIGEVTSGTFSPTLERPIAMAYVRPECAAAGTELEVDIRGSLEKARVVPLPFYRRPKTT
jgi:aminomethyltransferase